ncbi:copper chaperone PCu(A)C [Microvirga tunisiensis]|uniref:Copper chaperone PCu(A)C n=2 Tax=Pannonibacter tanglangensis TaxID=2750084 RepID=A0ABW9ZHI9_9HYPH|nr:MULTISPECIES: copper chaperone PCu(A)C [unclassified Pannonibacter]NBN64328.1 copper chaperone PCu(A)C [Pannonibacter sp. XCT-34]NBN78861.1 copper chaperone PCu(A)C [Pannonibacter sp. XCT-53]
MTFAKTLLSAALLSATVLTGAALPALAGEATVGDITVRDAWTRATPPNAMAGGGFLVITNKGSTDDKLVAASAPVTERTELHEMAVIDGVMKMREMESGIPVPAGATVELKPGGLHVMFMDIKQPLKEGETLPVTLTFEKAGTVTVEMPIAKIGAKEMSHDGHGGHGAHGGHGGHGQQGHGTTKPTN